MVPLFKTRNTISSSAEFEGAHTSTRTRYLRLELTTSGFYTITLKSGNKISKNTNDIKQRVELTNSFPEVGKNPSLPSTGIMSSLRLLPLSHGDACLQ